MRKREKLIQKALRQLPPGTRVLAATPATNAPTLGLSTTGLLLATDTHLVWHQERLRGDRQDMAAWKDITAVTPIVGSAVTLSGNVTVGLAVKANDHIIEVNQIAPTPYYTELYNVMQQKAPHAFVEAVRVIEAADGASVADELAKLAALRESGVLSEDEFAEQKRRLLG